MPHVKTTSFGTRQMLIHKKACVSPMINILRPKNILTGVLCSYLRCLSLYIRCGQVFLLKLCLIYCRNWGLSHEGICKIRNASYIHTGAYPVRTICTSSKFADLRIFQSHKPVCRNLKSIRSQLQYFPIISIGTMTDPLNCLPNVRYRHLDSFVIVSELIPEISIIA